MLVDLPLGEDRTWRKWYLGQFDVMNIKLMYNKQLGNEQA